MCGSSEDCCGGRTCLGSGHCEGYATPGPTPVGCDTCLLGRVGHWNFDELSSGFASSSDGTTIIERGSSEALVGVDASITGSGSISPLVADGKFGSALVIPAGTANYAVSLGMRHECSSAYHCIFLIVYSCVRVYFVYHRNFLLAQLSSFMPHML